MKNMLLERDINFELNSSLLLIFTYTADFIVCLIQILPCFALSSDKVNSFINP